MTTIFPGFFDFEAHPLLRILAKSTQKFDILVTVKNFPGFLVFPDQEIGHFSRFPTGN